MASFSAKINLISAIIDTPTSWHIAIDVVDEYGIYYADDSNINDIIYDLATANMYKLTVITAINGTRLLGKVAWVGQTAAVAPVHGSLVIGRVVNGIFTYTNSILDIFASHVTQEFLTQECVIDESFKADSVKVYLNGIRLHKIDDYTITDNIVNIIDFELEDVIVIDYERL